MKQNNILDITPCHKFIHFNEFMRLKALEMNMLLKQARMFVLQHNSSIGHIGEEILRSFLQQNLPKRYKVTQGFVSDGVRISPQCDIIIFDSQAYVPFYSYGNIEVIPANSVVATIEVKTSINKERFCEVLKRFQKLYELGVDNNSILVFSYIMPQTIENYIFNSLAPQVYRQHKVVMDEDDIYTADTYTYDVCDYDRLPRSIAILENGYCLCQSQVQDRYNDYYGYAAYQMTDGYDKEVASLQIFMDNLLNSIQPTEATQTIPPLIGSTVESKDDIKDLSYKYAFKICPM